MKAPDRHGGVKVYKNQNVYEAAKARIRWVFEEFEEVLVNVSGGKDSTVVFQLALEVATEMGRLPLAVMWLDQEMEWQATADSVKQMMSTPGVKPYWYQVPFRSESASSSEESRPWLWNPETPEDWIRPKDPMSIHENTFGTDKFYKLLDRIPLSIFPGKHIAQLTGVRCEESPVRALGLTVAPTYKWATWGKKGNWQDSVPKDQRTELNRCCTMHPIYDWTFSDVWASINKNNWPYCKIYDEFYRFGVPRQEMRVSAVHHEMSIRSLWIMQEIERDTYQKLVTRLSGADSGAKFGHMGYFPTSVPTMFGGWEDYRDYLLENLITNLEWRETMRKQFADHVEQYKGLVDPDELYIVHVKAILTNDHDGIRIANFTNAPDKIDLRMEQRRRAEAATAKEI